MTKRSKLALIILVGLLLLAAGLYLFLQPYFAQRAASQPPALPSNVQQYAPTPPTNGNGSNMPSPPTPIVSQTPEQRQLLTLEQAAKATVERIGSGVSTDGFLGYQDAMSAMTPSGQSALLEEQKAMQAAHPARGTNYGISTRVVSSKINEGVMGDRTLVAIVQAIQVTDAGDPSVPTTTKGKKITVTFVKQANDAYLIDTIVWEEQPL